MGEYFECFNGTHHTILLLEDLISCRAMKKIRIAYIVVSHAPYRTPLYEKFASDPRFEFKVFYERREGVGGRGWHIPNNANFEYEVSKSLTLKYVRTRNNEKEQAFIFVPFDLFIRLIRFKPDVLISMEHSVRTLWALLYKSLFKSKLIVTFDGTSYTERNISGIKFTLRRYISRKADVYFVLSDSGKDYLISQLKVPEYKIIKTPFFCDITTFSLIDEMDRKYMREQLQVDGKVFLMVGELTYKKNVTGMLNVWSAMGDAFHKKCFLVFAGKGPLKQEIEIYRKKFRNILVLDHIKYDEMPRIYNMADILIHPALEDQWALVVNEALASGLQVLVSKYAGASELVADRMLGCIFDPLNNTEWKEILNSCLEENSELDIRKTRQAIAIRLLGKYSLDVCFDKMINALGINQ